MSKNNQPLVTIGMIVKNEEEVLERCLKSLQPLKEAVPCEVIIADTGSTDNTWAIAEKYADEVFHFEWVNDFAAARNAVLDHANGVWYLSMDADEYFSDDISELVAFLKAPESQQKYEAARYIFHNYTDEQHIGYIEVYLPRLYLRTEKTRYEGKIHERIPLPKEVKIKKLDTVIYHTGYVFAAQAEATEKAERNLALLLQDFDEHKTDLPKIAQVLDAMLMAKKESDILKLAEEVTPTVYSKLPNTQAQLVLLKLMQQMHLSHKYEKIHEYLKKYEETAINDDNTRIDFYYVAVHTKIAQQDWQDVEKYCKKYFALITKKRNKELVRNIEWEERYHDETCIATIYSAYLTSLKNQGKAEEALNAVTKQGIEILTPKHVQTVFSTVLEALCQEERQDIISLIMDYWYDARESENKNEKEKANTIEAVLLHLCQEEDEYWVAINQLANCEYDNHITRLYRFMLLTTEEMEQQAPQIVDWSNNRKAYTYYYVMFKNTACLPKEALNKNSAEIQELATLILQSYSDFARVIYRYCLDNDGENTVFLTTLYGLLLVQMVKDGEKAEYVMDIYTQLMEEILPQIYTQETRTDENCYKMEANFCFGYWMMQAYQAQEDIKRHLYCLKEAVYVSPKKKEVVDYFVQKLQKKLDAERAREENRQYEMNQLAEAIKQQARVMIQAGQLDEAREVLAQLAQLCPDDEEVEQLSQMLIQSGTALNLS